MKEPIISTEDFGSFIFHCNRAIEDGNKSFNFKGTTYTTGVKYLLALMAERHNLDAFIDSNGHIYIKRARK